MNDNILANLQRALRFTFKSGNLIYIVGIAVILSISMNINASHMLEQAVQIGADRKGFDDPGTDDRGAGHGRFLL